MYDYQRSSQEGEARAEEHYGKKIWSSTHPRNFGNHVPFNAHPPARPTVRPHHRHTNVNNSINRYGNPNATRGYFGGKWHSHPRLVKQRQLKSQSRRKRKAEIISVSVSSCPQIWNVDLEKDREKEKVGGRPAKLNEKEGKRDLEREIKNKGGKFSCWKNYMKILQWRGENEKSQRPPMQSENERQQKKN